MSAEATADRLNGAISRLESVIAGRVALLKQEIDTATSRDAAMADENQRLRTALEEALGNVDNILAELKGKI
jgi:hypothetical protein